MHECIVVERLIIVNYYTPYKNTFADMLKAPVDDPKSLFFRMCFYMVPRPGLEPGKAWCLRPLGVPISTSHLGKIFFYFVKERMQ